MEDLDVESKVIHVEVVWKPSSLLSRLQTKEVVEEILRGYENPCLEFSLNDPQHLHLKDHIQSIRFDCSFCQANSSHSSHTKVKEIIVEVYQLEKVHIILYGNAETSKCPIFNQWTLPAKDLANYWNHLVIDPNVKKRLLQDVENALKDMKMEMKDSISLPNKITLIHGPTGTGKTALGRALAHKLTIRLGFHFNSGQLIEINCLNLYSKLISKGDSYMERVFQKFEEFVGDPKCLVFFLIDQVTSLNPPYHVGSPLKSQDSILNQFLKKIDQVVKNPNVFVVFTSTLIETMDLELIKKLDVKIYLGNPPPKSIYEILAYTVNDFIRQGLVVTNDNLLLPPTFKNILESNPAFKMAQKLFELATFCTNFNGREIRKLPLEAQLNFIKTFNCSYDEFLIALKLTIDKKKGILPPPKIELKEPKKKRRCSSSSDTETLPLVSPAIKPPVNEISTELKPTESLNPTQPKTEPTSKENEIKPKVKKKRQRHGRRRKEDLEKIIIPSRQSKRLLEVKTSSNECKPPKTEPKYETIRIDKYETISSYVDLTKSFSGNPCDCLVCMKLAGLLESFKHPLLNCSIIGNKCYGISFFPQTVTVMPLTSTNLSLHNQKEQKIKIPPSTDKSKDPSVPLIDSTPLKDEKPKVKVEKKFRVKVEKKCVKKCQTSSKNLLNVKPDPERSLPVKKEVKFRPGRSSPSKVKKERSASLTIKQEKKFLVRSRIKKENKKKPIKKMAPITPAALHLKDVDPVLKREITSKKGPDPRPGGAQNQKIDQPRRSSTSAPVVLPTSTSSIPAQSQVHPPQSSDQDQDQVPTTPTPTSNSDPTPFATPIPITIQVLHSVPIPSPPQDLISCLLIPLPPLVAPECPPSELALSPTSSPTPSPSSPEQSPASPCSSHTPSPSSVATLSPSPSPEMIISDCRVATPDTPDPLRLTPVIVPESASASISVPSNDFQPPQSIPSSDPLMTMAIELALTMNESLMSNPSSESPMELTHFSTEDSPITDPLLIQDDPIARHGIPHPHPHQIPGPSTYHQHQHQHQHQNQQFTNQNQNNWNNFQSELDLSQRYKSCTVCGECFQFYEELGQHYQIFHAERARDSSIWDQLTSVQQDCSSFDEIVANTQHFFEF